MFHSKFQKAIRVSDLRYIPSNFRNAEDDFLGRICFYVNRVLEFRNIPVRRSPDGEVRLELSAVEDLLGTNYGFNSSLLCEGAIDEIQRQVRGQLMEVVQ